MNSLQRFAVLLLSLFFVSWNAESSAQKVTSHQPGNRWEESYVTGNGRMGAMLLGDPVSDTLVANHCRLFLPLGSREILPDLASVLPQLRATIQQQGYGTAMKLLLSEAKQQGFPGLIPTDPFHPGLFVHIQQRSTGEIHDYLRTQDMRTGEVRAEWQDDRASFARRLFVSRADNAIVLLLTSSSPGALSCDLQFPAVAPATKPRDDHGWRADVDKNLIQSTQSTTAEWVTYHNTYTRGKGGYDAVIRVVVRGGKASSGESSITIEAADEALLMIRIVPWKTPLPANVSEAWAYSSQNPDFDSPGKYEPTPPLALSSVVAYQTDQQAAELMPQLRDSLAELTPAYDRLFEPHAQLHTALFDRASIDLGGGDSQLTTDELLAEAQRAQHLPPQLAEQIYDAGRYMFICSAGELPPNLQGIWTGTWEPAWSGDFTLDTNLQLAIQHAHSAHLGELMAGYYRMIESFYPDWRANARKTYGCRGVLTNPRASNTPLLLHWGKWEGIYWTAGCGWLAHFFDEHWGYTGDERFLRERTVPLLMEVASFYEDFASVDEETGKIAFIPSYSPESGTGATATMDVMICRETLSRLIAHCRRLEIETDRLSQWQSMLDRLPDYRINDDEALAEWVSPEYGEHYQHRHLSHLYACFEATGALSPDQTPELWAAAQEANRRRIHSGGEVSSHGRMHMGLAAAHLGMAAEAYGRLAVMATGESMYSSLMCSHEPGRKIFNVDANGAMPELIHRMIFRSQPGELDLLPALPAEWPQGEIRGQRARQQITIDRLAWNQPAGEVELHLTSDKQQSILLRMPAAERIVELSLQRGADVRPVDSAPQSFRVDLPAGERVELRLKY